MGGAAHLRSTQNWNGTTDTDILPSVDRCTVNSTSFVTLMSPTLTEIAPLH
jgi:hypothetical protein